jgi:hypothetical protein
MMSYKWFATKMDLFPNVKFPGTHYGMLRAGESASDEHKPFSLTEFVEANMKDRQIFLGGRPSYPEEGFDRRFAMSPYGITNKIVPVEKLAATSADDYYQETQAVLNVLTESLSTLPNVYKYPETTWEWTIGRDFRDRLIDMGAQALEMAIPRANENPNPLIYAVYLLETAISFEINARSDPSPALLKNAGLGHIHMVQNKKLPSDKLPFPAYDLFGSLKVMEWPAPEDTEWKKWSSEKFIVYWGEFLARPEAKNDHQYEMIKGLHAQASNALKKLAPESEVKKAQAAGNQNGASVGGADGTNRQPGAEDPSKKKSKRKKDTKKTKTAEL